MLPLLLLSSGGCFLGLGDGLMARSKSPELAILDLSGELCGDAVPLRNPLLTSWDRPCGKALCGDV